MKPIVKDLQKSLRKVFLFIVVAEVEKKKLKLLRWCGSGEERYLSQFDVGGKVDLGKKDFESGGGEGFDHDSHGPSACGSS